MRTRKRSLSLLLCGALLFSLCPQTASAVSIPKTGAESSGLCEHHTEHNADCGYTEGIEETPCNHEHTEDCYTLVTESSIVRLSIASSSPFLAAAMR